MVRIGWQYPCCHLWFPAFLPFFWNSPEYPCEVGGVVLQVRPLIVLMYLPSLSLIFLSSLMTSLFTPELAESASATHTCQCCWNLQTHNKAADTHFGGCLCLRQGPWILSQQKLCTISYCHRSCQQQCSDTSYFSTFQFAGSITITFRFTVIQGI